MTSNSGQKKTTKQQQASIGPIAQQLTKIQANGRRAAISPSNNHQSSLPQQLQRKKRNIIVRVFLCIFFFSFSILFLISVINGWRTHALWYNIFFSLLSSLFSFICGLVIINEPRKRIMTAFVVLGSIIGVLLEAILIAEIWQFHIQVSWMVSLSLALLSVGFGILLLIIYKPEKWPDWTGFGEYVPPSPYKEGYQRGKTLWDWLNLIAVLLVPLMIAAFTITSTIQQGQISQQQHDSDQKIAHDQQQAAIFKAYLDDMTDLMLNHGLRQSKSDEEVSVVARAKTLTALQALDSSGKKALLQFLYEAKLIGGLQNIRDTKSRYAAIISLDGADLEGADLGGVKLRGANLSGTTLFNAELNGAYLDGAVLDGADLDGTDLDEATLNGTSLIGTSLIGASLVEATLREANLDLADLGGVDLAGVDLSGAILKDAAVKPDQLAQAYTLKGATLPDGSTYPSQSYPLPNHTEPTPTP